MVRPTKTIEAQCSILIASLRDRIRGLMRLRQTLNTEKLRPDDRLKDWTLEGAVVYSSLICNLSVGDAIRVVSGSGL